MVQGNEKMKNDNLPEEWAFVIDDRAASRIPSDKERAEEERIVREVLEMRRAKRCDTSHTL